MRTGPAVFLEILRPHNMLAAALGVVAGFAAAGGRAWGDVWTVAALTALATGAGNVVNDCFDVGIDRVNKPSRPLPSGRLSLRAAAVLYACLSVLVVVGAPALVPVRVAVLVLSWQVALFAYARWAKRWLVAGNLLVAAIAASAFVAGAMAAGHPGAAVIPAAIAFAFVVCREVVKGGEDLEGDRASGVRTIAVLVGRARAGRAAAVLMLVVAMLLPAPAVAGRFGFGYFLLMGGIVVPVLVAGAIAVAGAEDRKPFARTSRALKLAMFAGIAAIALGA